MTTDIAVLERALIVMAVCMTVQTLLCIGAVAGAFIAWRRASQAVVEAKAAAEGQVAELRGHLERITETVDQTARSVRHGTETVGELLEDVRSAMGTVGRSVGNVASAVTAPRAALAVGLWQGLQYLRRQRASQQRTEEAAPSEM